MSFVKDYLDNKASPNDIDDYVESWHQGTASDLDLHQYLGFTKEEYNQWALHPSQIQDILDSYKF